MRSYLSLILYPLLVLALFAGPADRAVGFDKPAMEPSQEGGYIEPDGDSHTSSDPGASGSPASPADKAAVNAVGDMVWDVGAALDDLGKNMKNKDQDNRAREFVRGSLGTSADGSPVPVTVGTLEEFHEGLKTHMGTTSRGDIVKEAERLSQYVVATPLEVIDGTAEHVPLGGPGKKPYVNGGDNEGGGDDSDYVDPYDDSLWGDPGDPAEDGDPAWYPGPIHPWVTNAWSDAHPKDPRPWEERAEWETRHGEPEDVIYYATEALDRGSESPKVLFMRGAAYEDIGDHENAHQDAASVLAKMPNQPQAKSLYKLTQGRASELKFKLPDKPFGRQPPQGPSSGGGVQKAAGLPAPGKTAAQAIAAAKVTKGAAEKAQSLSKAGDKALKVGDLDGAMGRAEQALELDPDNALGHYVKASAHARKGEYAEAVKSATRVLEIAPKNPAALNTRARALNLLRKYRPAHKDASMAIMYSPKNKKGHAFAPIGYYNRAHANAGLGRRDKALLDLRRAAFQNPAFKDKLERAEALPADADLALFFEEGAPRRKDEKKDGKGKPPMWPFALAGAGALVALGAAGAWRKRMTTVRRMTEDFPEQAPAAAAQEPEAGSILGHYEVVREIGAGGMGVVYEAFDQGLERTVAVKKMRTEIRKDERERERFLSEARTVAKMRHPNLVEIYSIEEAGDDAYLIFEFVEGRTLTELVSEKGRLTLPEALVLFEGICSALDYAHARGVVHRDLKPSNIMIDKDGVPKVMDFGVARQAKDAMTRLSMTNTVCGTPAYMAPEQEQGVVGRAVDIFALGACLYELLTGVVPFDGTAGAALMSKLEGKYVQATVRAPDLPESVDGVLAKALDPRPERRFATAGDLYKTLKAAAGSAYPR